MADQEEQQEVMLHTTDLVEGTEIVTESQVNEVESEEVSEDILQQALEEAQEGFGQETVEYTTENVAVSQEMIVTGDESNLSVADGNVVSEAYDQGVTYRVVDSMPLEQYVDEPQAETTQIIAESNLPAANTGTSLILQGNFGTETPLGSSANPIRIVQQGNQYTSMQQLTPEQLSHIMQVVQQQQVARNAQQGGGSSVLFNPSTQTRIVYRVIHPQELHKNNQNSVNSQQLELSQGGTQVVQKRTYRKRNRDDEEKFEGPELSKEEKEERKKHRPRTRSGRVSRPPKHMVKEYKHIHPLDWDEDYDDSDGGYSDFKMSEEEDEEVPRDKDNKDSAYIIPGLGSSKPKNFRCEVCQKAYIGKAGLARHFRLNPSHGNADELVEPVNGVNGLATEDSNSNSSSVDTTATTKTVPFKPAATPTPATTVNSVPRGVLKARQQLLQESTPVRRKQKLRDLIKQCEDEELMEIVLPRLAKVITVWEFLLMKVEKGKPLKPHFPDVYKEFETLHKQVQKMCMEFLRPPQGGGDNAGPGSNRLEICDTTVAQSLGLNLRSYEVRNSVEEERQQFQYKLLTTDPQNLYTNPSQNSKRTIELVSQAELVSQPPAKRARVEESENLPPTVVVTSSSSVSTPTSAANVLHTSGGADSMPAQILEDQPVMESVDDSMPYEEEANGEQVVGTIVDKDNSDVIKQQEDEQTTMMTTTTEEGEEEEVPVNGTEMQVTEVVEGELQVQQEQQQQQQQTVVCNDGEMVLVEGGEGEQQQQEEQEMQQQQEIQPEQEMHQEQEMDQEQEIQQQQEMQLQGQEMQLQGQEMQEQEMQLHEQEMQLHEQQHVEEEGAGQQQDGEVVAEHELHNVGTTQVMIQHGDGEEHEEIPLSQASILQTPEGIVFIQNPDGTTFQLQHNNQSIPLETVQALLAMETGDHTQYITGHVEQTE